jgi:predicted acyltransferase
MNLAASKRLTALDVFRGITVCFMIIVNTPGDGDQTFSPLLHARWHGFTPTDLVFPSFLFAVGNAMTFALDKWQKLSQGEVLWKILKRTAIIFLLGYLMYWFPFVEHTPDGSYALKPFARTRILGVLQRIALCYGMAALILYYFRTRTVLSICAFFLLAYWAVMIWFGGTPDPLTLETNAALRLDLFLFGDGHLYHGEGLAFDPEGLLSTFPAIVNVVGGYYVGRHVRRSGTSWEGLGKLLLAGAALLILAYSWNLLFPVNKKLWTSSFVALTLGLDAMILGIILYLTEFRGQKSWTGFFEVFGKNPLFIYLLSEVLAILFWFFRVGDQPLYSWLYGSFFAWAGAYWGSLLFALVFMMICWLAGWWMDRKKIYVRV